MMLELPGRCIRPSKQHALVFQDRDVTVSNVKDKLARLTARTGVWQARIKVGSTASFPLLERRLKINRIDFPDDIKTCNIKQIKIVSAEFRLYFNNNTFHVTETRLTLKWTLLPKKQRSWQISSYPSAHHFQSSRIPSSLKL